MEQRRSFCRWSKVARKIKTTYEEHKKIASDYRYIYWTFSFEHYSQSAKLVKDEQLSLQCDYAFDQQHIHTSVQMLLLTVRVVFFELSLCTFGANAAALVVSAGKGFIRRRALICFARSVPCGRSLNNVAFANSYYFDTHSAALHYCTQAVSETVCFVCHYLLQIKYSAFCTRCSEFWNSVREKHNSFYAKTNKIGNDLFVFYKLPLLSTFLLPPTALPLFQRPCISAENLKALKTEKRLQLVATNPGWQSVQFVSLFVPKKSIALMA